MYRCIGVQLLLVLSHSDQAPSCSYSSPTIPVSYPPIGSPYGVPVSTLSPIPDTTLCEIAAEVTNIWEHLGVKLGVPFSKIQTARSSNPGNLQMAVITMLRMWQTQKGSEATPQALKKALLELKYRRVAMNYFPKD